MPPARRFGFRGKLFALIGLFLVGFAATQAVMSAAVNTVKVDGPLYREITRERDLLNDLTPPALFLRGPYILLVNLSAEPDPARRRLATDLYRDLERQFHDRESHYLRELPDGPMKTVLRDEVVAPANEFYAVAGREVMPLADAVSAF